MHILQNEPSDWINTIIPLARLARMKCEILNEYCSACQSLTQKASKEIFSRKETDERIQNRLPLLPSQARRLMIVFPNNTPDTTPTIRNILHFSCRNHSYCRFIFYIETLDNTGTSTRQLWAPIQKYLVFSPNLVSIGSRGGIGWLDLFGNIIYEWCNRVD